MLFVSAAALIDEDGRVLIAQRPASKPMAGLWEFPGGKIHDDETPEQALVRELKEELGIITSTCCLSPLTFVTHPINKGTNQPDDESARKIGCDPLAKCSELDPDDMLLLMVYICRRWHGIASPKEGQTLKWLRPNEMAKYPMPPADKPIVQMLHDFL